MEKYGLVKTGGGNVTLLPLCKLILYGEPSEIEQAKKKAVSSIDLFRELFEQYSKDVQIEQIKAFLRQKANVDISKAQKMAENIDMNIQKSVKLYYSYPKGLPPLHLSRHLGQAQAGGKQP